MYGSSIIFKEWFNFNYCNDTTNTLGLIMCKGTSIFMSVITSVG